MSNQLITNANAPVVDIKITIDFRYSPESIKVDMSPSAAMVPGLVLCQKLALCVANLLQMIIQGQPQQEQPKPPDLPPVPSN